MTPSHGAHRVLVYARSSQQVGAAQQLSAGRHIAKARGWSIEGEYLDLGSPGSNTRPEFERLLADVRHGGAGVVITTGLSVLFADQREAVRVLRDLAARGFDVVLPADGIDTTGGCDFGIVMAALANLDRQVLRDKIRLGLAEARRLGKPVGRKRVEVPVAQAQALLTEGKSLRETSRTLGVAVGTLHRALRAAPVRASAELLAEAA